MNDRYYRVSPRFWIDHDWDDETRLASLYVLTSPHRTSEGLFRLPLAYVATDLDWPVKRVKTVFAKLAADDFIRYDEATSVCWIVKALKWQAPGNPNQVTGAVKRLSQLPANPFLNPFARVAETLAPTLAKELAQALKQTNGKVA